MDSTEQNGIPREQHEARGGAADSGFREELERVMAIGEQSLDVVKSSAELFKLEFVLAVRSIPKAVAAWLMLLPAALLVWLSFSALCAWAAFELSGQPLVGFATLFALQLVSLFLLRWALKKYQRSMSFPYTTESVQKFRQELADATAKKDSTTPS